MLSRIIQVKLQTRALQNEKFSSFGEFVGEQKLKYIMDIFNSMSLDINYIQAQFTSSS